MRRADKFERVISFCSAAPARAFVHVEIMMQLHKRKAALHTRSLARACPAFPFPRRREGAGRNANGARVMSDSLNRKYLLLVTGSTSNYKFDEVSKEEQSNSRASRALYIIHLAATHLSVPGGNCPAEDSYYGSSRKTTLKCIAFSGCRRK